jgi:glycosyltransferase involved in cell wall biosynthesis
VVGIVERQASCARRSLRVLHVAQPSDGGVAFCAASLAQDQVARGWSVGVATPDRARTKGVRESGAHHYVWNARRDPGVHVVAESRRLRSIVAAFDPDVVHLHSAKAGLCGRLVVRGRRPTIYQPNGWSFYAVDGAVRRVTVAWERFAARWSTCTVCVSHDERTAAERLGFRAAWSTIHNGVDIERWRPPSAEQRAAARRALGVTGSDPVVVTVARLSRQKGVDVLFRAWPGVRQTWPVARLVVVGDGPDRAQLERERPAGAILVGESDPTAYLRAADLFVAPSRWEGESFAVMEAMAQGLPVIATCVSGTSGLLGAEYLTPVDDSSRLADVVAELLRDPHRRALAGHRNRRFIEEARSVRTMHERMAALTVAVATSAPPHADVYA